MTDCGHHMRGTWTRHESTSTCGKYFPRGSTLASHEHKTVAELYSLARLYVVQVMVPWAMLYIIRLKLRV